MEKAVIWNLKKDLESLFAACSETVDFNEDFFFYSTRDLISEIEAVKNMSKKDAKSLQELFASDKRELLLIACGKVEERADKELLALVANGLRELSEWYEEKREKQMQSTDTKEDCFSECISPNYNKEEVIYKLHSFIDGKGGSKVGYVFQHLSNTKVNLFYVIRREKSPKMKKQRGRL